MKETETMIISPQRAFNEGLITNVLNPDKQVGSDGIDLTLLTVNRVDEDKLRPAVLTEDKKLTMHRQHTAVTPIDLVGMYGIKWGYILEPGIYDFAFTEGCNLTGGVAGLLLLRSSFVRNGCIGQCGLQDNGFRTTNLGMMVHINCTTVIEHGMRIAQAVLWESASAKEYNGTYQGQVGTDWQQTTATNVK
jgi:deoxycytidine triphosphate deaminase